ncbi:MAG: PKD domain-containing protein, partial [Bacteroidales bacterium]|nr:PKD domain-containing protein [Bacteroidales bacterium]
MGSAIFCGDISENATCIPIVTRNSCFANDGMATICLSCKHATVCNNLICNNDGEGVNICHGKSYANVFNNTIAKNWQGPNLCGWANGIFLGVGEYAFYSYHGAVFNNISIKNYSDSALLIGDSFREIYMSSGTDSVDYFGNNCVSNLYSCTAGENGIYTSDAQFVNPTLGNGKNYYNPDADWSLMSESPCRDAGIILDNIDMPDVDFLGYERIVGTIDIGAIEYQVGPTYPTANFKADRVNVNETAVVNFTDLSVNNPTSWEWTFEGGTPATSNQRNPSVTYNTAGVYDVSLSITNEFGSDYVIKEEYITVYLPYYPIAEFTADNVNVKETSIVNFTDLSTNSPFSWEWTFEGGTPATSTEQNPSVTYSTAGTYNVSLTITNQFGNDYEMKQDYITVYVPYYPVSNFIADNVNIYQSNVVNFTDLSTNNPTSWLWRFVGGTPAISHEQNPTVTYNTPGTFDVSLTVTNEFGSDYVIKED